MGDVTGNLILSDPRVQERKGQGLLVATLHGKPSEVKAADVIKVRAMIRFKANPRWPQQQQL